ncbi:MAG: hypothetical protein WD467_00930 [Candidatus Saccharimonadales bacterium]
MMGRNVWWVVSTLTVIAQAYFLPGITAHVPALMIICLLISTQYLSRGFVFAQALWLGFILDVVSLYDFGAYLVVGLVVTSLIYWLKRRGLGLEDGFSRTLLLAAAVLMQSLVLLMFQGPAIILELEVGSWLIGVGGQILTSAVFAWAVVGRVQLRA